MSRKVNGLDQAVISLFFYVKDVFCKPQTNNYVFNFLSSATMCMFVFVGFFLLSGAIQCLRHQPVGVIS